MSKAEFLGLTFRQWSALVDEHHAEAKRRDSMTEVMLAQAIAMIANTGFKGWDKPRKAEEFMPSKWNTAKAKPRYQRRDRVAANVAQIFGAYVAKG